MSETDKPEKPDKEYWAGPGGENWARHNGFTESLFSPVTAVLLAAAAAKPGERVVDVGCGCGGTALALAKQVGQAGFVLGIDVSAAMLDLARRLPRPAPGRNSSRPTPPPMFSPSAISTCCARATA